MSSVNDNLSVLSKSLRSKVDKLIAPTENILFCINGSTGMGSEKEYFVALDSRLIHIHEEFWITNRITSINYCDITSVDTRIDAIWGQIRVSTNNASYTLIKFRGIDRYLPYVNQPKDLIQKAKSANVQTATPSDEQMKLVSELERLAALYKSGVLTEDEFKIAKSRLLNS